MDKVIAAVEKNSALILETEKYIWKHPETGYKEYKTTEYMAAIFVRWGMIL